MAIFNTPRAGRQNYNYMEKLITNMWNAQHSIFRQGYGVFASSAANIINTYQAIQNSYQKGNNVKVHYLELWVELDKEQQEVVGVADCIGRFFFNMGYQSFITVTVEKEAYLIAIVVNAVSFGEQAVFHDNNYSYMAVLDYLKNIAPYGWKVTASENMFFDPKIGEGNYVHGKYA